MNLINVVVNVGSNATTTGNVPRNASRVVSFFLQKDGNTGYCENTGRRNNCRAKLKLEILSIYRFYEGQLVHTNIG